MNNVWEFHKTSQIANFTANPSSITSNVQLARGPTVLYVTTNFKMQSDDWMADVGSLTYPNTHNYLTPN